VAYAKERSQFGKAIAEFQGIQFMLADMAIEVEAARQLVYRAAAISERGEESATYFGAAAKCFASDVAMRVTTDAVQVFGGYGYVKDYPVERFMRDAKIQIYEERIRFSGSSSPAHFAGLGHQLLCNRRPALEWAFVYRDRGQQWTSLG
jgi:hypothetical protein